MKNGFFIIALETFLGHLDGCSKLIIYLGCRVAAIQCHGDVRFHSVSLLGKVLMSRVCDNVRNDVGRTLSQMGLDGTS